MNILLDLDGTVTDSRPGIVACIRYALERCRLQPPNDELRNAGAKRLLTSPVQICDLLAR